MTIKNKYKYWAVEELESLLGEHIHERDHFAETFTERSDLNKEIQIIKSDR